ncbi:amyloid-beta A4 precursor protein-binding family A member 3 [Fukomys damarensis]|uniref:amyloid-beta A4 precursor protein-binding family A member 3 n=1 Tax=Fukomys damarensis TaxID=885580 RepID=UPI0005401B43|nr:amyloid-beta A4 precursor protein-binding family A member 3 [Fukomys damarensis]
MEFLTALQSPSGPPAMDLEALEPPDDCTPDTPWHPVPEGPSNLSQMELEGSSVQDLVQQFEALPGDLASLSPDGTPCPLHIATGHGLASQEVAAAHGLLSAEAGRDDLLSLLRCEQCPPPEPCPHQPPEPAPHLLQPPGDPDVEPAPPNWAEQGSAEQGDSRSSGSSPEPWPETAPLVTPERPRPAGAQNPETLASCPALQEVPGPCDHEDLLDGVIFGAKYLGSTQLLSERNPPPSTRMAQAQEAMDRIKAPDGETQPMTGVDLFVSTRRIKVLTADSQEAMMDHALQTISYIADIGPVLVLMARRRLARKPGTQDRDRRLYKMLCHVFHSEDAQLIARAIGQAFAVAYSQFLRDSGIDPSQVGTWPGQGVHCPPVTTAIIRRLHSREQLGFCVEDGIICNLLRGGIAERGGVRVGHRIIEINGQSVVATPHARIIELLTEAQDEVHIKTMPAATYRLLTGQEQPVYL